MSHFNKYYLDANSVVSKEELREHGPVVPILVNIPGILMEAQSKEGIEVATPEIGLALIDTGASSSLVDEGVIQALNINPIGKKQVRTVKGDTLVTTYPASFSFPATGLPEIDFNSVLSSPNLKTKQKIIAIIGRDILKYGVFIYNGDGHISLSLNPNQSTDRGKITGLGLADPIES